MSCRRLRRELLELFRFGGLDWRSAPHLDHLAGCRECRDEVGLDRALVQQLRAALAERVAGAAPSADAWAVVLARAQAPHVGPRGWLRARGMSLVARVGAATAVSALALLMSTGTDVAIRLPQDATESGSVRVLTIDWWGATAAPSGSPAGEAASERPSAAAAYTVPDFGIREHLRSVSSADENETTDAPAPTVTRQTLVARPWSPVGEPLPYGPADDAKSTSTDDEQPMPTPPAEGPF